MAVRDDVYIEWHLSPRIIVVRAPSTEITIQDLHDTVRELEQRPENLRHPAVISTAGKEGLGGGVSVGLTATLINAVLSFEARRAVAGTGTVTTADSTGFILTDATASFLTTAAPGSWVVNTADGSVASVRQVLSDTQLLTDSLGGGSDNQFDLTDPYLLYPVIQCEVNGGNLVAVDEFGSEIDVILPTAGTQVVRTSSSSATLQEQLDIQQSSYNGVVLVDVNNTTNIAGSGVNYPTGTARRPVDNFADALLIAEERGLKTISVLGLAVPLTGSLDFEGYRIIGVSPAASSVIVDASVNVLDTEFINLTITGVFDGIATFKDCVLSNANMVEGELINCGLQGTITIAGSSRVVMVSCWDAAVAAPVLDFGGVGLPVTMRGYEGRIIMRNKSGPHSVQVDLNPGELTLESTVTAGTFWVRGVGNPVINNSTGTTSVDQSALISSTSVTDYVFGADPANHADADTFGEIFGRGRLR